MGGYSLFEIQKAIDAILSVDTTLLAMLGTGTKASIYDNPSQALQDNVDFPYIVYASNTAIPFDTKTFNGTEATITISAYSETGDKEEASNIIQRLHTLLHNQDLTVEDNNLVFCLWDGLSMVEPEDDDNLILQHGVIRFRIKTTES